MSDNIPTTEEVRRTFSDSWRDDVFDGWLEQHNKEVVNEVLTGIFTRLWEVDEIVVGETFFRGVYGKHVVMNITRNKLTALIKGESADNLIIRSTADNAVNGTEGEGENK